METIFADYTDNFALCQHYWVTWKSINSSEYSLIEKATFTQASQEILNLVIDSTGVRFNTYRYV